MTAVRRGIPTKNLIISFDVTFPNAKVPLSYPDVKIYLHRLLLCLIEKTSQDSQRTLLP
jgi:hypothetical protein